LIINEQEHEVFNEDINKISEKISGDILYLEIHHIIIGNTQQIIIYLKLLLNMTTQKFIGKTGLREYQEQKIALLFKNHKVKKNL